MPIRKNKWQKQRTKNTNRHHLIAALKKYILTISFNELTFGVSINIIDLFGKQKAGCRFKRTVWLQGFINYPDF